MGRIDDGAGKAHADLPFRSAYDRALFESSPSLRMFAFTERARLTVGGPALRVAVGVATPYILIRNMAVVPQLPGAER